MQTFREWLREKETIELNENNEVIKFLDNLTSKEDKIDSYKLTNKKLSVFLDKDKYRNDNEIQRDYITYLDYQLKQRGLKFKSIEGEKGIITFYLI